MSGRRADDESTDLTVLDAELRRLTRRADRQRRQIKQGTGARQLPWTSSSLSKILYFGRDAQASQTSPPDGRERWGVAPDLQYPSSTSKGAARIAAAAVSHNSGGVDQLEKRL